MATRWPRCGPWRCVPTRVAVATPTWATSSMRPETPAIWLGHDVRATRRVTLDGVAVAADDALEAGAGLLDVALELVARRGAATLVAGLELLELALGLRAGAEGVGDRAGGVDHAVARVERGADVGERGALDDRLALLRRGAGGADVGLGGVAGLVAGLRADAATGRLRRRGGRRRTAGAARGRLALTSGRLLGGSRLLRGGRLAGARWWKSWCWCLVFSAMWLFPPALKDWVANLCSPYCSRRTYVRKPMSWTGYSVRSLCIRPRPRCT